MKTHKHLWDEYISDSNIDLAIRNVCKHKTSRKKFRELRERPERYKNWIRKEAEDYHNSPHLPIEIYDGIQRKKRTIIVPTFREQIVHHMIINILNPIIMKPMYEKSYGSLPGRGAHLARQDIERVIKTDRRNVKYCLKMDVRKYFDSVPHSILKEKMAAKIKDERFLSLLYEIVDVTDKGIPLGFYTSQWIANWYLSDLDHYIKEQLRAKHYYRYMDDMVIFGANKKELHDMRAKIKGELHKLGLEMKDNWQVFRFDYIKDGKHYGRDLDFMGFRFFATGLSCAEASCIRRPVKRERSRKRRNRLCTTPDRCCLISDG